MSSSGRCRWSDRAHQLAMKLRSMRSGTADACWKPSPVLLGFGRFTVVAEPLLMKWSASTYATRKCGSGITGLWQVHGRSRTTFDEMVRLDLRYSRMCSPISDLKILLQTPRAVFSGDGAY